MSLSSYEQTIVNRLLIERESAFNDVVSIEEQIRRLTGAPFPFPPPDSIPPSMVKRTRKSTSKPDKTTPQKPLKLRRLKDAETAYALSYLYKNTADQIEFSDLSALQSFLENPLTGMRILSISTIDIHGDDIEFLFSNN